MITDHPNFEAINSWKNDLITTLKDLQKDYARKNDGNFFQGLKVPSQGKLDGITYAQIDFGQHPGDQVDSWYSFAPERFNSETVFPAHVTINTYKSEDETGWTAKIEFWKAGIGPDTYGKDGDHWVFQHNEGFENFDGIWEDWFMGIDESAE